MSNDMKRVFLYVRVSTEEQAVHGLSIEAQTAALEDWAKANGHKVVGLYVDAGISARKPSTKRPALQRLLDDVRAGKGDMVVFTKLDRWFRSVSQYYQVQDVLEAHNVSWRAIHEDYETATASGRLKVNIMLSVAQDEADRTSERIKAINEMKRQKLEPLTGQMPYGYILEGKKIVKDPKTQKAVEIFFKTLLETGSVSGSQQEVFEQCGIVLNYERVYRMMKSTAYYGRYFNADGMVPPYVTKQDYDKIQEARRKLVRKSPKNHIFLFSGLIVCAECGRRMGTRRATHSNYQYYACPSSYRKTADCNNRVCINEKNIEQYILDTLDEKIRKKKIEYEKEAAQRKEKNYKAEISAVRGKLKRLKSLYIEDIISIEDYREDYAKLTEKLEELSKLDKPEPQPNFGTLDTFVQSGWKEAYFALEKERKKKVWRSVIREIRVYPDRHIEFDLDV